MKLVGVAGYPARPYLAEAMMLMEEIDQLSRALDRLTRIYMREGGYVDPKTWTKIVNRIERSKQRLLGNGNPYGRRLGDRR